MVKQWILFVMLLAAATVWAAAPPQYFGLSTDVKPVSGKYAGATFFETDTNRTYIWNAGWTIVSDTTYFGGTVQYSFFDANGRYKAFGDSSLAYGEMVVTPNATRINPANTKPDYGIWLWPAHTYLFDAAAPESLFFEVELPHDHKTGTAIDAHVHWGATSTDAGNVAWKLVYSIKDIGGTFAFAAGDTLSARQAGSGTAGQNQFCDLGDVSTTSILGVSAILTGILYRDAARGSDTYTGDAALLNIGFHYRKDVFGSRWETIK